MWKRDEVKSMGAWHQSVSFDNESDFVFSFLFPLPSLSSSPIIAEQASMHILQKEFNILFCWVTFHYRNAQI